MNDITINSSLEQGKESNVRQTNPIKFLELLGLGAVASWIVLKNLGSQPDGISLEDATRLEEEHKKRELEAQTVQDNTKQIVSYLEEHRGIPLDKSNYSVKPTRFFSDIEISKEGVKVAQKASKESLEVFFKTCESYAKWLSEEINRTTDENTRNEYIDLYNCLLEGSKKPPTMEQIQKKSHMFFVISDRFYATNTGYIDKSEDKFCVSISNLLNVSHELKPITQYKSDSVDNKSKPSDRSLVYNDSWDKENKKHFGHMYFLTNLPYLQARYTTHFGDDSFKPAKDYDLTSEQTLGFEIAYQMVNNFITILGRSEDFSTDRQNGKTIARFCELLEKKPHLKEQFLNNTMTRNYFEQNQFPKVQYPENN